MMYVLTAVLLVLLVAVILYYNKFITLKNMLKEAASGIDVQLKRRHDLVPNLIMTVKGYAKHEKTLFEKVAETRSVCLKANGLKEKADPESELGAGISRLLAVAENYPELKAGDNFLKLQKDLAEVEDNIQYARRYYNGVARDYNNATETFPGLLIAKAAGFSHEDFFELKDANDKEVVSASFKEPSNV